MKSHVFTTLLILVLLGIVFERTTNILHKTFLMNEPDSPKLVRYTSIWYHGGGGSNKYNTNNY